MPNFQPNPLYVVNPILTSVAVLVGHFDGTTTRSDWISTSDEFLTHYPNASTLDQIAVGLFFTNGGQHLITFNTGTSELNELIHKDPLSDGVWLSERLMSGLNPMSSFDFILLSPQLQHQDSLWFRALQAYCDQRDAILLLNPPELGIEQIPNWFDAHPELHKRHVAMYYPALLVDDKTIGATYAVAGIFNRLDQSFGVWASPSGANAHVDGIHPPVATLSNPETLRLNNMGINCIRTFKSIGTVVWGNTTGVGMDSTNSYWKYIPVRRTIFFIKKSVIDAVQPLESIPYYSGVEDDVMAVIEPFLLELHTRGAFAGRSDKESYSLLCEPSETGILISIGVALLKPDELLVVKIPVTMAQVGPE